MGDRRFRLRHVRHSAWMRGVVAMLAATLALLPAVCLCAPAPAAPAPASRTTTQPCHGSDDSSAPSAPAHQAGCSHCHAGVALPATAQASVSLAAASLVTLVAPVAGPAGAVRTDASRAAPSPAHPPGRTVLQHKCVLLV